MDSETELTPRSLAGYNTLCQQELPASSSVFSKCPVIARLPCRENTPNIIIMVPAAVQTSDSDAEIALENYLVYTTQEWVKSAYDIVLCVSNLRLGSISGLRFLDRWYSRLPKEKRQNLRKVYLLHLSSTTETILNTARKWTDKGLASHIVPVENIEELFKALKIQKGDIIRHFPYLVQKSDAIMTNTLNFSVFGMPFSRQCQLFGQPMGPFHLLPPALIALSRRVLNPAVITTPNLFKNRVNPDNIYAHIQAIDEGTHTWESLDATSSAMILRLLFSCQPGPLFGEDVIVDIYEKLGRDIALGDAELKEILHQAMKKLSGVEIDIVKFSLALIKAIMAKSDKNLMTDEVLAEIIAPVFFKPKYWLGEAGRCISYATNAMRLCLVNPLTMLESSSSESESESVDGAGSELQSGSVSSLPTESRSEATPGSVLHRKDGKESQSDLDSGATSESESAPSDDELTEDDIKQKSV